ncbi:MAG: hypothetical protein H6Q76_1939 [Firmicutes bacterium]|nr:hypothetical protein [Bacillota bacterium]
MDTKQKVNDLLDSGLTQQELAKLVPCSQSAISAYANGDRGARPSYQIGKRLDELHAERCKEETGISSTPPSDQSMPQL